MNFTYRNCVPRSFRIFSVLMINRKNYHGDLGINFAEQNLGGDRLRPRQASEGQHAEVARRPL